jgi:ubiquinone/menaquinone biosynthesis C-methylase UbiE
MNINILKKILICPNCSSEDLIISPTELKCLKCNSLFSKINGIYDLSTKKTNLPNLKIYNNIHYKKLAEDISLPLDYLYSGKKSIVTYIQNAGHRQVKKLLKSKKYNYILDLGCGDGAHYPYVKENENIFGIDLDLTSLKKSKKKHPDFTVLRGSAYSLPLKNDSVDCLISIYNLEHLAYLDIALEEIYRVLTPKGDFFVSLPNEGGFAWNFGRKLSTARKFSTSSFNFEEAMKIDHINCIYQLDKALKRYFTIEKQLNFPFIIPTFKFNLVTTYHCRKKNKT